MSIDPTESAEFDDPPFPGGGSNDAEEWEGDEDPDEFEEVLSSMPDADIKNVKRRHEKELCAIEGVVGVGIESDEIGDDIIVVSVQEKEVIGRVPAELEGFAVRTKVTGEFEAL